MIPFPNQNAPFVDAVRRILRPWNSFLQQFTQQPAQAINVFATVTPASPFTYLAREPGVLVISGGTITALHLIRGLDDLTITGTRVVPMAIQDSVIITYSVVPTKLYFLPSYGVQV